MCGIVCAFDLKQKSEDLRPQILEMAKIIRHRGPDWSGIYSDDKAILAHERLAIVDPASGKQPLFSADKKLILAANGEIYNHRALRKQFPDYNFQTESDCEVILALYQEKGVDFVDEMNGVFGFAIYDVENLDNQLDFMTKAYLEEQTSYDSVSKTASTSVLMSWFRGDFGGKNGAKKILFTYKITPEKPKRLDYKTYDWALLLGNFRTIPN